MLSNVSGSGWALLTWGLPFFDFHRSTPGDAAITSPFARYGRASRLRRWIPRRPEGSRRSPRLQVPQENVLNLASRSTRTLSFRIKGLGCSQCLLREALTAILPTLRKWKEWFAAITALMAQSGTSLRRINSAASGRRADISPTALHWRAARLAPPGKGRSPNNLPIVVASTL